MRQSLGPLLQDAMAILRVLLPRSMRSAKAVHLLLRLLRPNDPLRVAGVLGAAHCHCGALGRWRGVRHPSRLATPRLPTLLGTPRPGFPLVSRFRPPPGVWLHDGRHGRLCAQALPGHYGRHQRRYAVVRGHPRSRLRHPMPWALPNLLLRPVGDARRAHE